MNFENKKLKTTANDQILIYYSRLNSYLDFLASTTSFEPIIVQWKRQLIRITLHLI